MLIKIKSSWYLQFILFILLLASGFENLRMQLSIYTPKIFAVIEYLLSYILVLSYFSFVEIHFLSRSSHSSSQKLFFLSIFVNSRILFGFSVHQVIVMFSTSLRLGVLFTILFCSSQVDGFKVLAIVPLISKSHFSIGSSIVRSLHDAGHEITMISAFPLKNELHNYRDISIEDVRERKLKGSNILK